jgi:hypothetical protein
MAERLATTKVGVRRAGVRGQVSVVEDMASSSSKPIVSVHAVATTVEEAVGNENVEGAPGNTPLEFASLMVLVLSRPGCRRGGQIPEPV